MFAQLLLLFILVPLADLMLLLMIAKWTHWATSMLLVLVSGLIGVWLIRRKWISARSILQDQQAIDQLPPGRMTNGFMVLIAAGLLITPGLITDLLAVLLLIPATRNWCKLLALHWLKGHYYAERIQMKTYGNEDGVIDGEIVSSSDDRYGQRVLEPERIAVRKTATGPGRKAS